MRIKIGYILLYSICSMLLYFTLSYHIQRTDTAILLGCWTLLFALYSLVIIQKWTLSETRLLIGIAFVIRVSILFSIPTLSDDFYRFIWDGRLSAAGINPYLHLPSEYASSVIGYNIGLSQELFTKLNSPSYFTVYPPVLQGVFLLAVKIFPLSILGNIFVMKLVLFFSEICTTYFLLRLLKKFNLPTINVLLYLLNPLIIVEVTGNIHFEGVMISFVVLAIYFIVHEKLQYSAIALGFAVSVKLLPLIFIPLLLRKLSLKQFAFFCFISGLTVFILFIPFLDAEVISHMLQSVGLYFRHFEFNASVFYIIRWIGFETVGYDVIAIGGKIVALLSVIIIVLYSLSRKKGLAVRLFTEMQIIVLIYLLLALVVHPWYISGLILYSVFNKAYYPILWSFLVGFTYVSYQFVPYTENGFVIVVEYSLVTVCFLYEYFRNKRIHSTLTVKTHPVYNEN